MQNNIVKVKNGVTLSIELLDICIASTPPE